MLTERHTNLLLMIFASAMLAIMVIATLLSEGITNLDGRVGVIDHLPLWDTLDSFSALVYTLGDWGCHQDTARSFVIGDSQMPFCIRETMMVVGTIIGCIMLIPRFSMFDGTKRLICAAILLGCATPLEWLLQHYCGLDNLFLVGATGMFTGIGVALGVHCLVRLESNYLVRKNDD